MADMQQHHRISCEIEGQSYEGNYWIAGKILVVSTSKGGTSRQLGMNAPDVLARQLLNKLVMEGKA